MNLASVAFSMALTWPTPSLPILRSEESPVGPINTQEESWMTSLTFLGAVIASPVFSYISQQHGRKIAGYMIAIPFIIGWLPFIFTNSTTFFYIGRFLVGVSSGAVVTVCPMYVGEISEDKIRGTLGAIRSTIVCTAGLLVCSIGPLISIQTMAVICIIFPFLFVFGFFWLPESPMFLMRVGKSKEAMEAMIWLRGGSETVAEEEIRKLNVVIEEGKANPVSMKELISARGTRRGLMICVVLAAGQQLSGITPVISYSVSLFESAGGSMSPYTAVIIVNCVQTVGSIITSALLDIAGRRILLISSEVVMTVSLATLGVYFFLQNQGSDVTALGFLPLTCVSIYVLCISIGLGAVPYVIMAEIFSPQARGIASTITVAAIWIFAFVTSKFYPDMVNLIGLHGCYWTFALISVLCTVYTIFKIPETKNRSLESILSELNGDKEKDEISKVPKVTGVQERY